MMLGSFMEVNRRSVNERSWHIQACLNFLLCYTKPISCLLQIKGLCVQTLTPRVDTCIYSMLLKLRSLHRKLWIIIVCILWDIEKDPVISETRQLNQASLLFSFTMMCVLPILLSARAQDFLIVHRSFCRAPSCRFNNTYVFLLATVDCLNSTLTLKPLICLFS